MICRFQLYYFSNTITKEKRDTILTIDTRGNNAVTNDNDNDDIDDVEEDPLQRTIQTK